MYGPPAGLLWEVTVLSCRRRYHTCTSAFFVHSVATTTSPYAYLVEIVDFICVAFALKDAKSITSYVSPRQRAQRTFELLNFGLTDELPWKKHGQVEGDGPKCDACVEVTEDIREWDYGDYEGITSPEIRRIRKEQGLSENWDIWRDGCPGGE